jgi:hypothetical protein
VKVRSFYPSQSIEGQLTSTLLDTTLQMIRNIPALALIPLVILWFGIDETAGKKTPTATKNNFAVSSIPNHKMTSGISAKAGMLRIICVANSGSTLKSVLVVHCLAF